MRYDALNSSTHAVDPGLGPRAASASRSNDQHLLRRLLHVQHRPDLTAGFWALCCGIGVLALVEHERNACARLESAANPRLEQDPEQLDRSAAPTIVSCAV